MRCNLGRQRWAAVGTGVLLVLGALGLRLPAAEATGSAAAQAWSAAVEQVRGGDGGGVLPAEDAAGAVDGVRQGGFACHTGEDPSPWWQVDLGEKQALARVHIVAPHCPERLNLFEVQVAEDGLTWATLFQYKEKTDGKPELDVTLGGQAARYVRIRVPRRTWMHLSEVEVYGVAEPARNLALRRPATQSSVSQWSERRIQLERPVGGWRTDLEAGERVVEQLSVDAGAEGPALRAAARRLAADRVLLDAEDWATLYARAAAASERGRPLRRQVRLFDPAALGRALDDLAATFPERFTDVADLRRRLAEAAAALPTVRQGVEAGDAAGWEQAARIVALQREVLLANPLLDVERLLLVRRRDSLLGLPANWQSNCVLPRTGYGNDLAILSPVRPDGELRTVYRPPDDTFVGDVELHADADRVLFSKSSPKGPWQVYELALDPGTGTARGEPRQVTPDMGADINNYDACYLPNGELLFGSTAPMVAVPCVNGSTAVANLFRLAADGSVRQLCFDQEHNWCPAVMNDGRVLYLRWEYADLPHANSRILFRMNPDGTAQSEYYGSNSYWPNGVFYARPIPGHPTRVVGVVTGHHGVPRMGELVIFDSARGRREADGAVQRIPGWGKPVEPLVRDALVDGSWPKFLHPFPLGLADGRGAGKYFLVSMQPEAGAAWGLYLVDVFDNLLLLKELPGYALFEPVPLAATPRPPVVPDRVDPGRRDGLVLMADIGRGPGLKGLPPGTVKALRVVSYTYGYRGMGGLYGTVGIDGPWDVRRVLGTVPVEADGSAYFRVPANVPVAVLPLDAEGKAVQLMRSWFTAMPGEVLSCVGCHESQSDTPPPVSTLAARRPPAELAPWYGPARGFAFEREVQPVLDRRCSGCHNGTTTYGGRPLFTLRGDVRVTDWQSKMSGHAGEWGGRFSRAYVNLHRYVRHPGIESDIHLLAPMDFHADATELVQILKKGHYGVALEPAEWEHLTTWIDLNTPYHGDWQTIAGDPACANEKRRAEMRLRYAGVEEYHVEPPPEPVTAVSPAVVADVPARPADPAPALDGWPLSGERARGLVTRPPQPVELGDGVSLAFVYVPPGAFVMGAADGEADERPAGVVRVERGFWMTSTEISNRQYARFDPAHDSRREDKQGYQFGVECYPLGTPDQPVVRVAWQQAQAYCEWLARTTRLPAALPTEAQWEYACRAGTGTAFAYGDSSTDFSRHANLADAKTAEFASDPYTLDRPIPDPPEFDDWLPKDTRFNDGALVSTRVGSYQANAWGLADMHGNVAEWTRSLYHPYPYADGDGRNDLAADGPRVVRGGSWRDRPQRCRSAFRLPYRPYQPVFNVGFRVVIDADLVDLPARPGADRVQAPAAAGGRAELAAARVADPAGRAAGPSR